MTDKQKDDYEKEEEGKNMIEESEGFYTRRTKG